MSTSIRVSHPNGEPHGAYQMTYYVVKKDGSLKQLADFDLTHNPDASAKPLKNEVVVAECQSQSGGFVVFGSEAAQKAWKQAKPTHYAAA